MTAVSDSDIVKQLREQARLAQAEKAKTDALFSSIGEGVIATDEHGDIIRVNQAALDLLGYSRARLIGKWFPEAIPAVTEDGTKIDNIDRCISKVFLTGTSVSERIYYKTHDGSLLPVQVSVAPVILRGKPVGAIEIFRDISQDILMDKVKTNFISIASHQLRTPLSSINTYAHMLDEGYAGELDSTQSSFLTIILSAATRMNNLINTLLNVTRIEAGNVAINPQAVRLETLLGEIIAELSPEAREHKVSLSFTHSLKTPVMTDAILIKEVFSNLVSNAIKYTPEGGQVKVNLRNKGNKVVFSAADNGYGIPLNAQRHIFTKFYRAENVISREVGGTGLGLYLTKIIADNLNGELWFTSREDKGTTFYFALPIRGSSKKAGKFKLEA